VLGFYPLWYRQDGVFLGLRNHPAQEGNNLKSLITRYKVGTHFRYCCFQNSEGIRHAQDFFTINNRCVEVTLKNRQLKKKGPILQTLTPWPSENLFFTTRDC
jgi:hypothetical protein